MWWGLNPKHQGREYQPKVLGTESNILMKSVWSSWMMVVKNNQCKHLFPATDAQLDL